MDNNFNFWLQACNASESHRTLSQQRQANDGAQILAVSN